ncbi:MAG: hypothetical protein HY869_03210 [Chloroflexi bacterium]|nr:hypothetical protein [Chloroflexota bacterium]
MLNTGKAFLVLILLLTACTSSQPASSAEGEDWIAFSADKAQTDKMLDWLFPAEAEYWSPTEADVHALEDGLPAYLQENQSAFHMTESPVWEQLEEYNRQYVGIVLDGQKVIYANYLCRIGAETEWKEQFIFVADGGACYFQFKFDASTGRFFDLLVNGEA